MMHWDLLLCSDRFGSQKTNKIKNLDYIRSQFQRDYDRIIFSSPFRRLQDKTQVFPLPGSVFVHNRLTHSLEVASIGRSLGNMLAFRLKDMAEINNKDLFNELGSIVSAACLSHDLGNPPFGHSGEEAISRHFLEEGGSHLISKVNEDQWNDLIHFEGNANAFRILTHQFEGRRKGGFALTYSTTASLVKYPYGSDAIAYTGKKKYGFFTSDKNDFITLAEILGIPKINESPVMYARHPLVYLVEAADDISYLLMDIEDAHKLNILTTDETINFFISFFHREQDTEFFKEKDSVFREVTDVNERIAYLRARVIGKLIKECIDVFLANYDSIMNGTFKKSLVDYLPEVSNQALKYCKKESIVRIYNHRSVIEIELSGYNVIGTLLEEFVGAIMNPGRTYSRKLLELLPIQFRVNSVEPYLRIRSVLDYISGMTDLYAVDLYKKLRGISY